MSWLVSDIPHRFSVDELVVRRYDEVDAPLLVDAVTASLPELLEWMPWAKFEPQTVDQRAELIRTWSDEWDSKTSFTFGIFHDDQCVGGTGFHLRGDVGELEIGYWVATEHTGRGIASRVSRALVDIAFSLPEIEMVTIAHDRANFASQRVPEKLGFNVFKEYEREPEANSETGIARVWRMTRGQWAQR